jgi:hypothetical protein
MRHTGNKRRFKTVVFSAVLLALLSSALLVSPFKSSAKSNISTPTINCNGATQTSINILVTAGATGLPAGFTLQWIKADDLAANGGVWPDGVCGGSFSGNANLSRYNLAAGESVSVNVGEFLFDNGASTTCPGPLECDTTYVFRAFGHATNSLNRSDFTPDLTCSTLPCFHNEGGCTFTQGYWKTHGPVPVGNNEYVWPDSVKSGGMTLGTVNYTASQLLSIFNQPAGGNGLIALAHQLIAAKLNIANGASTTAAVDNAIINADALIGNKVIPPVGTGSLPPSSTAALITTLTDYNEGATGPGHCQ